MEIEDEELEEWEKIFRTTHGSKQHQQDFPNCRCCAAIREIDKLRLELLDLKLGFLSDDA